MKKSCAVMLIVVGVAFAIWGCIIFGMDAGYDERDIEYGGDAYTGIQNAAAQTANNVHNLAKIVKIGFGGLFEFGGIVFIIVGANGMPAATSGYTAESWYDEQEKERSM